MSRIVPNSLEEWLKQDTKEIKTYFAKKKAEENDILHDYEMLSPDEFLDKYQGEYWRN